MAKCLNIVKVLESACTLLNPATAEEWLCLYNTSRELRNPLIHRRVMLTFIKKVQSSSIIGFLSNAINVLKQKYRSSIYFKILMWMIKMLCCCYILYLLVMCITKFFQNPTGLMIDFEETKYDLAITFCAPKYYSEFKKSSTGK